MTLLLVLGVVVAVGVAQPRRDLVACVTAVLTVLGMLTYVIVS